MVVIVGQGRGAQNNQGGRDGQEKAQVYYAARQVFDGKRMRKAVQRRTIDYFSNVVRYVEDRTWRRNVQTDEFFLQPDNSYAKKLIAPQGMQSMPVNCVATKFVHTSINKVRCPIYVCKWTPEGRRLITGAASGEFTLWNGLTFNFETILQAHDEAVYSMVWSHDDNWMVTGDHGGKIKYWQSNMNNVKDFHAHKDPVREIAFCPTDFKFVTCSDDSLVKLWDFRTATEERTLTGHGWDVKCVDWHPTKALIVSGGKDNQIKLWDPRTGSQIQTLHPHKNTVLGVKWNKNGNWFLSGGRDSLCKLFDVRMMREVATFKSHKKEVTSIAWHPVYETLFASGGADGSLLYWLVGGETGYKEKLSKTSTVYSEVAALDRAHEHSVWSLDWHPLGHILVSASGDHATRFWARNRPGDVVRDRHGGGQGAAHDEQDAYQDFDDVAGPFIPGLEESDMDNYVPQQRRPNAGPPSRGSGGPGPRGGDRQQNQNARGDRVDRKDQGRPPMGPPPSQQQQQQQGGQQPNQQQQQGPRGPFGGNNAQGSGPFAGAQGPSGQFGPNQGQMGQFGPNAGLMGQMGPPMGPNQGQMGTPLGANQGPGMQQFGANQGPRPGFGPNQGPTGQFPIGAPGQMGQFAGNQGPPGAQFGQNQGANASGKATPTGLPTGPGAQGMPPMFPLGGMRPPGPPGMWPMPMGPGMVGPMMFPGGMPPPHMMGGPGIMAMSGAGGPGQWVQAGQQQGGPGAQPGQQAPGGPPQPPGAGGAWPKNQPPRPGPY